jgi:pyrroline-5-carboxylate reductase
MRSRSIGFIGGGRVTRILLGGFERAGVSPETCVVSDTDADILDGLKRRFPFVTTTGADLDGPAGQEVVFGALHPPALKEVLPQIGAQLRFDGIFISLAPVIRIPALKSALGGSAAVARMIPNAGSIVGSGFNPIAFAPDVGSETKQAIRGWLKAIGDCPEVRDEQLEAFAILTAMGPTYFWYQFEELQRLGTELGLDEAMVRDALPRMLEGGVKTYFASGMPPDQVIDLVPVKPLESVEKDVRDAYRTKLRGLFAKLTGRTMEVPTS